MFKDAVEVQLTVSDLHLGEGPASRIEDFKYHEPGQRIDHTDLDYALDGHFAAFLKESAKICAGKKMTLIINGDFLDPLAVQYQGKYGVVQYETANVDKVKIIIRGHRELFDGLREFLSYENHRLLIIEGNHDIALSFPKVRAELISVIAPEHPERLEFNWKNLYRGVYTQHGENEPHDRIDHTRTIIRQTDWPQLIAPGKMVKLLRRGELPKEDFLDVPQGHYMVALQNALKEINLLMGRMHVHGFVWLDAGRNIGKRSWYRSRLFAPVAACLLAKTILQHWTFSYLGMLTVYRIFKRLFKSIREKSFTDFAHLRMKSGVKRIFKVLWWTIAGVIQGKTTRDLALKILHEHQDIDVVVMGHEHQYCVEMHQISGRTTTYINTGTWMPQWKAKEEPLKKRWKRFRWLQWFPYFWRGLYKDAELVHDITCPVLAVSWNAAGERTVRLMRFDYEEKTLKKLQYLPPKTGGIFLSIRKY